jgi:hypothetical protein
MQTKAGALAPNIDFASRTTPAAASLRIHFLTTPAAPSAGAPATPTALAPTTPSRAAVTRQGAALAASPQGLTVVPAHNPPRLLRRAKPYQQT